MRQKIRKILASMLMVMMALQTFGSTPSDSVKVYFRVGQRQFDPSLRNNGAEMDSFVNIVRKANEEDNIRYLSVSGYASPDGTSNFNERLSALRCDAIANYVTVHTGIDSTLIKTNPGGVAWEELRRMVAENPDVPSREKVLDILDLTPIWIFDMDGKIIDGRKAQLMSLDRGKAYRWMLKNIFPELRNAVAVTIFYKTTPQEEIEEGFLITDMADNIDNADQSEMSDLSNNANILDKSDLSEYANHTELSDMAVNQMLQSVAKPFYMDIKTNMLYDAALVPNIGAEFYLGKNITIYGEWMYAWWQNNVRHRFWQIYGGDIGVRWWFGRKAYAKPLTGHHLGVFGGILIFDFEYNSTGYMGGKPGGTLWDRFITNCGIEYGYSLPVAKRLNIDFSIGIGYMGGNYIKYFPFDNDYYREKEYKMRYFGPTKAEISLVWLIGRGNINQRKGGDK